MPPVRPLPLPSTTSKAGYDHIDPMSQWFLGGGTAPGANATGISDDDFYGLDLQNSGVGGLSFRAFSGNGSHFGRIDNTGVAFGGTFSQTGSASVSGSMTVGTGFTLTTGTAIFGGSATVANGFTVTTGVTVLGGSATVVGAFRVTGASTLTGAVTIASTLQVAATASFTAFVTMAAAFNVAGNVTMASALQVGGAVTMASTLNVAGAVTMASSLGVVNAANFSATLNVAGIISSDLANGQAPISVTSTTVCPNLNAGLWNGLSLSGFVDNGSYTGNGSASRLINLGYQPKCVVITTQGLNLTLPQMGMLLSTSSNTTIFCSRTGVLATAVIAASEQTRITSPGFIVDDAGINPFGNVSSVTYFYAAWRQA